MTKALITCGQNPGVYFLEKWFPNFDFIYGDAVFSDQISVNRQLLLPKISQTDYIHQLLNICLDNQVDAVFALSFSEQELLAEAVELFSEFDIKLYLPSLNSRKLLSNPVEIFQKLNFNGIKTASFRVTSSFAEFSKACLQLGYPTEKIAVYNLLHLDLTWIVDDQIQTKTLLGNPVISFTKAAKLFAQDELLLLRKFQPSTQKNIYAVFTDAKLESVWNLEEITLEETIKKIGTELELNGLFEIQFQQEQLFNIKPYFVK